MKRTAMALLASAVFSLSALAAGPTTSAALFGSWSVDVDRLPMPAAQRPKSVTITFTDEGAARLGMTVEVVDPSGGRLEAVGVTPLDGTPTPVKSNFEADVSATFMPRPDVLILQLAKNGHPASTRIYSVDADGRSMIETVAFFGADGQPVLRRNYFSRVR
jgi:hypothetical protein